jgi:hypothetical protein
MNLLKNNIAVIVSVLALIFSGASLYLTSLKPANINLSAGDILGISREDDNLYIHLPIGLYNTGALPGVINRMGLVLKDQKSDDAIFLK